MKKLTQKDIATIVKLRGLGFQHNEIGEKLGVTGAAIGYHLQQIRKQALKHGVDKIFKVYCVWLEEET